MTEEKNEYIEKLLRKYNNMEANGITPERQYYLGGELWTLTRDCLLCGEEKATLEQMKQFETLKKDFDSKLY